MATENGTTIPQDPSVEPTEESVGKGKGKAVEEPIADTTMDEDDDDDDDDDDDEVEENEEPEADDDDNMEEINLDNIVDGGRRTRGRVIDFAKAAEENPADEEDDDDDDDFVAPDENRGDKMDED